MKTTIFLVFAAAMLGSAGERGGAKASLRPDGGGGLVTLHADDPLAHTFGFQEGRHGMKFDDHMVKNCGSDLDVEGYWAGEFTVGFEGGTTGSILDLGTMESLRLRYGYEETVGGGQGFASIRNDRGRFEILKNYAQQSFQTLAEGKALSRSPNHVPILDDHVYLIRLVTATQPPVERFVKILVVSYEPGESVTIRWENLD